MEKTRKEIRGKQLWDAYRGPFLSAFLFGLLAYGFLLVNKIPVDDDLPFFFGKGATTISGRWGLALLRLAMPDLSIPWFYGLLSLLILSLAACLIVGIFRLKNPALRIVLCGLFVCFPAETGTISYTFTSAPYALALLLAIASVAAFQRGKRWRYLAAPALLLFSCSIYQGYFAFAASFCLILLIQRLLREEEDTAAVVREGLAMLLMLVLAAGGYGLSMLLQQRLLHLPALTADVVNTRQSLPMRAAVAYSAFLHILTRGYFGYVRGRLSLVLHAAGILLVLAELFLRTRQQKLSRRLLCLLALVLLPLAVDCLYLLADTGFIHSLALYSFCSVYVLTAVVLDGRAGEGPRLPRRFAVLVMALVLAGNVYFANAFSLCSYLEYENAKSFYTELMVRAQQTPGFTQNSRLALIGEPGEQYINQRRDFDFGNFTLPGNNIRRSVHAQELLRLYIGWDVPFAGEEELAALRGSQALAAMPCYPYEGSVRMDGDVLIVKLSD